MTDITIHWSGPPECVDGDSYDIDADFNTPGSYESIAAAVAATAPFASPQTTLVNALLADRDDVSIELTDATGFSNDDVVNLTTENALLGGKSGNTFVASVRGFGSNVALAHAIGDTVTKLHESRVEDVNFAGRSIIRFRITHIDGSGNRSVPAEFVAWNVPPPPNNRMATLYGIVINPAGEPVSGVNITIQMDDTDNYVNPVGAMLNMATSTVVTDNDGFWYTFVPRDIFHSAIDPAGGDPITIKVNAGLTNEFSRSVSAIPNRALVNILDVT